MSESTVPLNCRIPSELNRLLEAERKAKGISKTDVTVEALKEHFSNDGKAGIPALPDNRAGLKQQVQYLLCLSKSDGSKMLWEKIQREVEALWEMVQE